MFYMSHISWFEWLTLSKDIHDFIDEAKAHQSIHHFEETYHKQNEQYSGQPMLKNWSDKKGVKEGFSN